MHKLKVGIVWAGIILIGACAALGVPKPETFNEKVAAAYTAVSGVGNLTIALHMDGKITDEKKAEVREQLIAAVESIDAVIALHETDPAAAETRLQQIILSLTVLDAALRASR